MARRYSREYSVDRYDDSSTKYRVDDRRRDRGSDVTDYRSVSRHRNRGREDIVVGSMYSRPNNVIDVDLGASTPLSTFNVKSPSRQGTQQRWQHDQEDLKRYHCRSIERRNVFSARRYVDQDGKETVVLQAYLEGSEADERQFRWIHMQSDERALKDLQHFASGLAGIDLDEKSLIVKLISKVSQALERNHVSGLHLLNSVYRCDGHFPLDVKNADKWVVFLSSPYLSLDDLPKTLSRPNHHAIRKFTLFQNLYPDQESTLERDRLQVLAKSSQGTKKAIYLNQLWALSLSSGTLITSSPDPVSDILGPSVRLEDHLAREIPGQVELIKFYDPAGKMFFFPVAQCRTWFALMDKVIGVCLSDYGSDPDGYHLFDVKGQSITASDWQTFLNVPGLRWATLRAKLATKTPPAVPELQDTLALGERQRKLSNHRLEASASSRKTTQSSAIGAGLTDKTTRDSDEESGSASGFSDSIIASGLYELEDRSAGFSYPAIQPTDAVAAEYISDDYDRLALVPYRRDREAEPYLLSRRSTGMSNGGHTRDLETRRGGGPIRSESPVNIVRYSQTDSIKPGEPATPTREVVTRRRGARDDSQQPTKDSRVPPSRIPRYVLDSIPEVIVNQVIIPDTFQHIYFSPRAPQQQKSSAESTKLPPKTPIDIAQKTPAATIIFVQALFDFEPSEPTELRFRKGDRIEVLEMVYKDWWLGLLHGQTGIFPTNYVETTVEFRTLAGAYESAQEGVETADDQLPKNSDVASPDVTASPLKVKHNNVPPVFCWSTSDREDPKDSTDTPGTAIEDMEIFETIIAQVDYELSKGERFTTGIPGKKKYSESKLYRDAPEMTKEEVDVKLHKLEVEVTQIPGTKISPTGLRDFSIKMRTLVDILDELARFFIPAGYPCQLLRKYWGSVNALIEGFYELRRAKVKLKDRRSRVSVGGKDDRSDANVNSFIVVNAEHVDRGIENDQMVRPEASILLCDSCSSKEGRKTYASFQDAEKHLKILHFAPGDWTEEVAKDWIKPKHEAWSYQLQCDAVKLLGISLDHFTHLQKSKREICDGVCTNQEFDTATYRLPAGLVRAFQRLLVLNLYLGHTAKIAYRSHHSTSGRGLFSFIDVGYEEPIYDLGYGAEAALDEAKTNLMLMSRAKDYASIIQYDAIGHEYLLGLMIGDLEDRKLSEEIPSLPETYRKYHESLLYEVNHRPRRRLLRDLKLLREEVSGVNSLLIGNGDTMVRYRDLLNHTGFRTTTRTRKSMFDKFEEKMLALFSRQISAGETYLHIMGSLDSLAESLAQSIEIQQEDHGKAIRVFTIVTVVFLPLSFVTGLLGMNTADIRTTTATQWIYWAIALPMTVVVVILATFIGYGTEGLKTIYDSFRPSGAFVSGTSISEHTLVEDRDENDEVGSVRTGKFSRPGRLRANVAQTFAGEKKVTIQEGGSAV